MKKRTSFALMEVRQYTIAKEVLFMLQPNDKTVLRKITQAIDGKYINQIVGKYKSDFRTQHFDTRSHIFAMLYLQLSKTKTLRGLIDKLHHSPKLKRDINVPSLSQLSRKNQSRDYRVFEELYRAVAHIAIKKLGVSTFHKQFQNVKAIDSTIIQIAAAFAPKLKYENGKAGIKISTLLNTSQAFPEKVEIVPAKINDRKCIQNFIQDKESLYIFDRGYFDYSWYDRLTDEGYQFITRQVSNAMIEEHRSFYVEDDSVFDYEITLGTESSKNKTHNKYREILTFDEKGEEIRILTNIFDLPALEILQLYRLRWKIELFFKWMKQNLRIKHWLGHNENAIKIQIYSGLIAYILLLLLKQTLKVKLSVITLSRIVEANLIENEEILLTLTG